MERVGVKTLIECASRVQNDGEHASRQLAKGLEKLAMFLEDAHLHRAHFAPRPDGKTRIAIHPGSGSEKKNWPLEHWLRLADEFCDHEVIFITGEAEEARGVKITRTPTGTRCRLPSSPHV
jgi:heptosyltransferase-3